MIEALKYGFYTVDPDYLEYLNKVDSEVYYNPSYRNSIKPFIGVIVGIENYNYFIPVSSAKEKHKRWKNVSDEHFIIYEVIDNSVSIQGDIYKYYSDTEKMHILSVLDIKKMIPVPTGYYEQVVFDELDDDRYKDLFEKEYAFCLSIKDKVLNKVQKIYNNQKETGIVRRANCNFEKLEDAMSNWSGTVNKSNIFASYPGDAMWKSTENEYMLIPYIKDGKELIEFRLYGEAKFLLEGLSFAKTENNGLKVSGKMRNLKDNSWNADADVIWNSLETIDYPIVTLTNGTEFTDVDMGGDYSYAGLVNSTGQSNAGTASNASEYIFPYANERLIARGEYESLDAATLRLAINEIYARHGRQYDTQDLNAYFSSKSWYRPQYSKSEFDKIESQVLNSYERENIKILTGYRDSLVGKVGDIRGVYEVNWGEGGAQMTISGQPDAYVIDIIANYVIDATNGNVRASEFEGIAVKEGGSLYRATGEEGWISFVVNTDGSITVTDEETTGSVGFMDTYRKIG